MKIESFVQSRTSLAPFDQHEESWTWNCWRILFHFLVIISILGKKSGIGGILWIPSPSLCTNFGNNGIAGLGRSFKIIHFHPLSLTSHSPGVFQKFSRDFLLWELHPRGIPEGDNPCCAPLQVTVMHSMQAGYLEKAQKYTDKALMQLEKLKSKEKSLGISRKILENPIIYSSFKPIPQPCSAAGSA